MFEIFSYNLRLAKAIEIYLQERELNNVTNVKHRNSVLQLGDYMYIRGIFACFLCKCLY